MEDDKNKLVKTGLGIDSKPLDKEKNISLNAWVGVEVPRKLPIYYCKADCKLGYLKDYSETQYATEIQYMLIGNINHSGICLYKEEEKPAEYNPFLELFGVLISRTPADNESPLLMNPPSFISFGMQRVSLQNFYLFMNADVNVPRLFSKEGCLLPTVLKLTFKKITGKAIYYLMEHIIMKQDPNVSYDKAKEMQKRGIDILNNSTPVELLELSNVMHYYDINGIPNVPAK